MDITAQKIIGECLKKLRKQQALKQVEVAKSMGVPQSFVSKIENGEKALRVSDLFRYSNALNLSAEAVISALTAEMAPTKADNRRSPGNSEGKERQ